MSDVLWQLRYRSPLSPTKGMDIKLISTTRAPHSDAQARAVGEHWLRTKMAHPATRLISVERAIVMTEDEMRAELGTTEPAANGSAAKREPAAAGRVGA